jgi:transposase
MIEKRSRNGFFRLINSVHPTAKAMEKQKKNDKQLNRDIHRLASEERFPVSKMTKIQERTLRKCRRSSARSH